MIWVENLTKLYPMGKNQPPLKAVDAMNFDVREGEIFGFLGPNGAGKSPTIRMLTGLTQPTEGKVRMLGMDLRPNQAAVKKKIGVVPEVSNLYDELSAFDNLIFSMQLYGVPRALRKERANELLREFNLYQKAEAPFAKLSRGMKRALTVAAALAHQPPLIFLDEPTTGLDVLNARHLRAMIADFRNRGITVFLTTHYLEEAERLCDRVAIIVKGHIVALDTIDGLKSNLPKKSSLEIVFSDQDGKINKKSLDCNRGIEETLQRLLADTAGYQILAINTLRPTLEDVFVQLTGLSAELMFVEKGGKGGAYG